jgi:hypothetical protein
MANKPCKPKCVKKDGGQDHRCNTDKDRTPAQKKGDKKKRK